MRDIKFRAYFKNEKQYVYNVQEIYDGLGFTTKDKKILYSNNVQHSFGELLNYDKNYYEYNGFDYLKNDEKEELLKLKNEIYIEQFTGLKDKNGVDIYEGDIINWFDKLYIVCFGYFNNNYEGLGFYCVEINKNNDTYFGGWIYNGEIIGNIHENPELLEGDRK